MYMFDSLLGINKEEESIPKENSTKAKNGDALSYSSDDDNVPLIFLKKNNISVTDDNGLDNNGNKQI